MGYGRPHRYVAGVSLLIRPLLCRVLPLGTPNSCIPAPRTQATPPWPFASTASCTFVKAPPLPPTGQRRTFSARRTSRWVRKRIGNACRPSFSLLDDTQKYNFSLLRSSSRVEYAAVGQAGQARFVQRRSPAPLGCCARTVGVRRALLLKILAFARSSPTTEHNLTFYNQIQQHRGPGMVSQCRRRPAL